MAHAHTKHAWVRITLLYVVLVGAPLLGVWGVLQIGKTLTPPISVGGTWNIMPGFALGDDRACAGPWHAADAAMLQIVQSGVRLMIVFNDQANTTVAGTIHDRRVTAATPAFALKADAGQHTIPQHIRGELLLPQCVSHSVVPFVGVRQPDETGTLGGH